MADGSTCFNYKDEYQNINSTNLYKWGIGIIDEKQLEYGSLEGRTDWRDFISGYPNLIHDYQKIDIDYATEIDYKARRSILAYDPSQMYLIAVSAPGMTFEEMQQILLKLKVQYAINLDGGGSTRILQNGQKLVGVSYSRPVDNVLAVYLNKTTELKESTTSIIYRVQMGCFSQKKNAEILLEEIKKLGGIYKQTYIRQINGYYKLQAGAFSQKENAEYVANDLKLRGYNCFITTI